MAEIIALNKNLHQGIRIKANPSLLQSKDRHFAPLVVHEFVPAGQEYPVVFVKDAETGQFKAIALLGLKPNENLFYADNGWLAHYKPEALTLYPFVLQQGEEQATSVLCVDMSSPLLNKYAGELLFDQQGNQCDWLTKQAERVADYVDKAYATQQFIKMLLNKDLLSPQNLDLTLAGQNSYSLNGLYTINEAKLNALSDADFTKLRHSGVLPAIYASLLSMQRIQDLVRRKISQPAQ